MCVCVCVCVCVYLYMCRLSGPSRLDEEGPDDDDDEGSEVTAPRLKGFEWSKTETAMDARVLAPEHNQSIEIIQRVLITDHDEHV